MPLSSICAVDNGPLCVLSTMMHPRVVVNKHHVCCCGCLLLSNQYSSTYLSTLDLFDLTRLMESAVFFSVDAGTVSTMD
jgi:hypothetical protein